MVNIVYGLGSDLPPHLLGILRDRLQHPGGPPIPAPGWPPQERHLLQDRLARSLRQINHNKPRTHHDALEFPDGQIWLLTLLREVSKRRFFSFQRLAPGRKLSMKRQRLGLPFQLHRADTLQFVVSSSNAGLERRSDQQRKRWSYPVGGCVGINGAGWMATGVGNTSWRWRRRSKSFVSPSARCDPPYFFSSSQVPSLRISG